jgi:NDP-sugar pyrophosphorylase family protein
MAGRGTRFLGSRFTAPKPLIRIHDFMMIEHVIANLLTPEVSRIVLVSQRGFELERHLEVFSSRFLNGNLSILEIDFVTNGPAETAFLAGQYLDPHSPLVIANSDQFLDTEISPFYSEVSKHSNQGVVMTMEDDNPKWSYAKVDSDNCISEIVEKVVISKFATTGVYGFSSTARFMKAFESMKANNDTHAGELFVGPAYNHLPREFGCVSNFSVGVLGDVMYGLGIPSDLEKFISSPVSLISNQKLKSLYASQ